LAQRVADLFFTQTFFVGAGGACPMRFQAEPGGLPAQFTVLVVLRCHDCNSPFNGAYEGKCEISINRFATTHSGPDEILKLGLYDPD
jgi:hypothetical protein